MPRARHVRPRVPWLLALCCGVLSGACRAPRPAPSAALKIVRPASPPDDDAPASALILIYIDGRLVGRRGDPPFVLAPGPHRVEARGDGRFTVYRDVVLAAGDRVVLPIALHPDLDQPPGP